MSTTSSKVFLTAAASAISGLYSYYTGNSGFVGLSTGAVGTSLGLIFETCGAVGFDLAALTYFTTIFTGFIAEGASQATQAVVKYVANTPESMTSTPRYSCGYSGYMPKATVAIM